MSSLLNLAKKLRDSLDQDKSMGGFQLAKGGLGNQVQNTLSNAQNSVFNSLRQTDNKLRQNPVYNTTVGLGKGIAGETGVNKMLSSVLPSLRYNLEGVGVNSGLINSTPQYRNFVNQQASQSANQFRQGATDLALTLGSVYSAPLKALRVAPATIKTIQAGRPIASLIGGTIGGASSALSGGDVAEGVGRGAMQGLKSNLFAGTTSPLLGRLIPTKNTFVNNRIVPMALNVAQGVGMDKTLGYQTDPTSIAIDAVMGFAGGKNQFKIKLSESQKLDEMWRKSKGNVDNFIAKVNQDITWAGGEKEKLWQYYLGRKMRAGDIAVRDWIKKNTGGKLPGYIDFSAKVGGTDPLEALKEEARKYKSAEEFVKAQNIENRFNVNDKFIVGLPVEDAKLPKGYKISQQHLDAIGEENIMSINVYDQNEKLVGSIDYGLYRGEPNIKMIEVQKEHRRKGIATAMLDKLQEMYPDKKIEVGMSTPDGTNLLSNYDLGKRRKELTDLYTQATAPKGKIKIDAPKEIPSIKIGNKTITASAPLPPGGRQNLSGIKLNMTNKQLNELPLTIKQASQLQVPTLKLSQPTKKQAIQLGMVQPELNTQKIFPQDVSKVGVSSNNSIAPKKLNIKQLRTIVAEKLQESQIKADMARSERETYGEKQLEMINKLKKYARSRAFQEGDIETLRKNTPKGLVDKVVEAVREAKMNEDISDTDALDIALNLPSKSMLKIKQPEEIKLLKQLEKKALSIAKDDPTFTPTVSKGKQQIIDREWEKSLDDYANGIKRNSSGAVSVEPSLATKNKIKAQNQKAELKTADKEYKEWEKQLFGEANVRSERKAIDALARSMQTATNEGSLGIKNSANWKNKPKISFTRETMERNFEDIMGADAPIMKKKILEPIFKAEADRTKFLNKERAEIKALGIRPRSNDSALVQKLGEGKITEAQVRSQSKNADQIINAQKVLRQKYDTYLMELNKVLTRNGYDPIPKRKDYFHHFEDLSGLFEQVGVSLKASDLPTDINGLSADFKPGKTFFNASLQRKGDRTSIDAITGMDKYLEGASRQIYHTDNIQRLRNLEAVLREKYAGTQHLSNFVAELGEYTNILAGKKAMMDRAFESVIGRRMYAGANALKKQVGANMVGANLSSALTSFIPVTQTIATTNKKAVAQAGLSILRNTFKDDGFINNSNFLTSRIGSDRLAMTNWEKIGDKGFWLFKVFDNFTSQLAVRSKYLEGINNGLSKSEAMLRADEWGRKTLAGRSAGEMPTLFNSQTLGFLTQFQLEVNNQLSFIAKDIPRNFNKVGAGSALAQLFLYTYLFNEVYQMATGRRPAFDPIGVAQQAYEDYTNPNMKKGQATKNLVSNVSQQLPFTSIMDGGRIPIGSAIPNPLAVVTGESTISKELVKPLTYLLPPTGGGQIKKTIEGVRSYNQGSSTSPSGVVRFPIPQTPANRIRATLFGQWSTPEAQTYIREGRNVLGDKQSETFRNILSNSGSANANEYYNSIIEKRASDKQIDAIKATVKEKGQAQLVDDNYYYKDGDSVKTIDLSFTPTEPKLTGQKELDKKLISKYKGEITKKKNDITTLYEQGVIDAQTAEAMIAELDQKTVKSGSVKVKKAKAKKPKKVTLKSVPKSSFSVKFNAPQARKIRIATGKVNLPKIKLPTSAKSVSNAKGIRLVAPEFRAREVRV